MSLLSPIFLAAGLAFMAIPVAIHLLNRRRFRTVEWAAMQYLLAAMKRNRRRLRFESWLLLALRCLVLGLLGLALARPVGCADGALAGVGQRSGLHVLVIDDSLSMSYEADRPEARTHLDQAKRLARDYVRRLEPGAEQVAVIASGRPARFLVRPGYDLDAAASAIEKLKPSFAADDLAGAFRLAQEAAERAASQPAKTLILLTDATHSAFRPDPRIGEPASAGGESTDAPQHAPFDPQLATLARSLASQYRVVVHALGLQQQSNRGVAGLGTGDPLVRVGFGSPLRARLHGFGDNGGEVRPTWKLNDRPIAGGTQARAEPRGATATQDGASFDAAGPAVVEASLPAEDRLPADDVRRRVVDVAGDLKVLVVEGRRGLGTLQSSGAFLRLALAPPADPTAETAVRRYVAPELISDLELPGRPLGDYRAVILAGVGTMTDATATALRAYVEQGGSLLIFLGSGVEGDLYNRTLGSAGLLPGALVAEVATPPGAAGVRLAFDPERTHPIIGAFAKQVRSLELAQVFTYWRTTLDPARRADVVLPFVGGDPAITVQAVGDGRVVFVATSADAEWSTLPAQVAYAALVHELLGGAVGGGDAWMNRTVGDRVELPGGLRLTGMPTLVDPAQRATPLERVETPAGLRWRSDALAMPGLYRLSTGAATYPIAVNVPPTESDVRTLSADDVRQALGGIAIEFRDDAPPDAATADERTSDFSWPILLLLLPLLFAESAMALKFGRGKGRA